jgi:hypothetical protein
MQCQMNGEVAIIIVQVQHFQSRNDTAGIARKGPVFFSLCVYFNIAHGKTVL